MLKMLTMAAMLTTGAPTPAPSGPPGPAPCLTRQQIADIAVVSMASGVETARNACRPHLPATAYLATPAAAEYSGRLRAAALQRLPFAIAGLSPFFGSAGLSRETMESLSEEGLAEGTGAEFSRYLNPALCGDISEIIEIGATLSPDQMGRFFGAFGSLVDNILRVLPPEMLGPDAPAPAPAGIPASLDLFRAAPRQSPAPPPGATSAPPRPFLCRPAE